MTVNNPQLHELYAVPIWTADLPPITEEEREYIKNMEYIQHLRPNKRLQLTKKTYVLETEEPLARIKDNITKAVEHYWREVLYVQEHLGLRRLHSWITKHNKDDFHPWHQDPNTLVTAIYYPVVPANSGNLHFRKDLNYGNLFHNVMEMKYSKKTNFNHREWVLTPTEGMIVIFPGHVEHSVSESQTDEDRYALVVDYWPTGILNYNMDDSDWEQPIDI
jgi:uncharacterized protein (TIGR02466 family)